MPEKTELYLLFICEKKSKLRLLGMFIRHIVKLHETPYCNNDIH